MTKKAIILDLDGVVVDSPEQKIPSRKLSEAVSQLKDKYFICAATGRVWSFAKPVIQGLQLSDPSIISAGTQICNPTTGEILWQLTIDDEALKQVIAIFRKYPDWKLLHNDGTEDHYFNGGVYPDDFKTAEPVYFLEQVFVPDDKAMKIYEELGRVDGVTCVMVTAQRPGTKDLHVVNRNTTKQHAIEELLRILKVKKEDSIGVGDSHNDIHMFNAVGYKVAMGNAIDELKDEADKVIGPVKEDGLVEYLNSLK